MSSKLILIITAITVDTPTCFTFPLMLRSNYESSIIKNDKFRRVATNVKPDVKNRIVLSKALIGEDSPIISIVMKSDDNT